MPQSTDRAEALLFPGQGSQTADMRESVAAHRPDLLELAIESVGADPFERVGEGTSFAQPALYCASLAGWERAGRPTAAVFAGHSLGELAALVAAGAIDASAGLRLAVRRGALMQEAAERGAPGGMLALLGEDEAVRSTARRTGLTIANDNAPGQLVVSGPDAVLEVASTIAKGAGVRVIRLRVAGAFHTPAIESAVPEFRDELARVEITETRVPVFSSTTAAPFEDVRSQLADALTRPVRWRETLIALRALGIERFLEAGPGKVLTKLVRRSLDGVEAMTLERAVSANA
jgi:[acyl-carrier-protein] S-malonyltransferase